MACRPVVVWNFLLGSVLQRLVANNVFFYHSRKCASFILLLYSINLPVDTTSSVDAWRFAKDLSLLLWLIAKHFPQLTNLTLSKQYPGFAVDNTLGFICCRSRFTAITSSSVSNLNTRLDYQSVIKLSIYTLNIFSTLLCLTQVPSTLTAIVWKW